MWGILTMGKYTEDDRDKRICLSCGTMSVSLEYTMKEHTRMCMGCGNMWTVKHDRDKED